MKILFSKAGKNLYLADKERSIFCVDDVFYNEDGEEVAVDDSFQRRNRRVYDKNWYQSWMDHEGLDEPLASETTVNPEWEIDDVFGNYGFKNEAGDFVIEPQYAYAHEFTNGLAAVNLNRTWYRTPEGRRYYENHYGYIDGNGKTVIGFQYDEAYPFNKYGVAVVSDLKEGWHLIDMQGNEIPGARFPYLSCYYDFEDRFLEFSYEDDSGSPVGIYDTKERKIMLEPSIDNMLEWDEDCIKIHEDGRRHYINSKGEIIYPWLDKKELSMAEKPDKHLVSAVTKLKYTELTGNPEFYFEHDGKKCEVGFVCGLYSSKEKFLLPQEYDEIVKLSDDIWACYRDGMITVVKTEEGD